MIPKYRAWDKNELKFIRSNGIRIDGDGKVYEYSMEQDKWIYNDFLIPVFFTGLKDKNGREIFKGDIIEYKHYYIIIPWWKDLKHKEEIEKTTKKKRKLFSKERCVVTFEDGEFNFAYGVRGYNIKCNDSIHKGTSYTSDYEERCWDFEVIGNIYENPELLKEDK